MTKKDKGQLAVTALMQLQGLGLLNPMEYQSIKSKIVIHYDQSPDDQNPDQQIHDILRLTRQEELDAAIKTLES